MLAIPNTDARWHGTWLNLEQQKQGAEEGGRGNQHTNVVIPHFEGFPKESNHQTAHCMAAQFKVSRATMERNARYADQINTIAEQTEKTPAQVVTETAGNGVFCPTPQICRAAHIWGYAESRNMRSILPLDGSNSFNIKPFFRRTTSVYTAYYCRP